LNTISFSKAIDQISNNGGGRLIIPRGMWLTGPIVLKSNINLHVEKGALIVFSSEKELYPLVETSFEGQEEIRCQSPISGKGLENIAFTGEGIYDGGGDAWRFVKRFKMTENQWKELLSSGGVTNKKGDLWFPSESYQKGYESKKQNNLKDYKTIEDHKKIKDYLRPVMVSLVNCKNVLFDGPVFQNSPAWCIHPLLCENLIVRNVDVRNPWYSQNGDGLDIESCKNSIVYNCTFDVGDDAICIKSGRDKSGRDRGVACENIIVKDCVVYHGHGGVTVGSEMSGGVNNMHVSNCTFIGTDVGIRFKSKRGRGGVVENIFISNIDMINIPTKAISFNLYYGGKSMVEMLADNDQNKPKEKAPKISEETPQFKDIIIKDIRCKGAQEAIYLQGLPEMNLENVYLENLHMITENGLTSIDANGIVIKDLKLETTNYPVLNFHNSKNVDIQGLKLQEVNRTMISITGEKTENINIDLQKEKSTDEILLLGKHVNRNKIKMN
jgi:polygalacturonase